LLGGGLERGRWKLEGRSWKGEDGRGKGEGIKELRNFLIRENH
jgi:hypothetical protein